MKKQSINKNQSEINIIAHKLLIMAQKYEMNKGINVNSTMTPMPFLN